MLTAVQIHRYIGTYVHNQIELPLENVPGGSQYVVKNIDGLGPVKSNIVTTKYVGVPGERFNDATEDMRNIVIDLGLSPDYSTDDPFGDLRRALYPLCSPGMEIELHFLTTHMETVKIVGRVESFEPKMFTAEPTIQLSVVCPDPYFEALTEVNQTRTGPGNLTVSNPGTVEKVGFLTTFWGFAVPASQVLSITQKSLSHNINHDNEMAFTGTLFLHTTPSVLAFNSVPGEKYAQYYDKASIDAGPGYPLEDPTGAGTPLIGWTSGWGYIRPGDNTFAFTIAATGMTSSPGTISIAFTPRYVGL